MRGLCAAKVTAFCASIEWRTQFARSGFLDKEKRSTKGVVPATRRSEFREMMRLFYSVLDQFTDQQTDLTEPFLSMTKRVSIKCFPFRHTETALRTCSVLRLHPRARTPVGKSTPPLNPAAR
jgi:lipid A disaccharide synthetase